ncbi:MAG: four-carbon acid sugar kinase family protein [Acidobacteria bacterium]|nr:four-carbon acid sugar kinase family protein [Acidobacteriota bacterium]MCW5969097.1 four-carbon acid sugar kinase family protein [Blastocatellales bacterium]
MTRKLLLTFYGDDFTGSADAMESLSICGVRCVLFLSPPSPALLRERFPEVEAVGVAGASRTMTPEQMEQSLPPIFGALGRLQARLFHYKVCSTFDSSPAIGSIGKAYEIGQRIFHSPYVPLLVGAPALKRYCIFGNLFATVEDETFRLDRHPMMSRHPVTPMAESDLRLHLRGQTDAVTALFDLLSLSGTTKQVNRRFAALLGQRPDIVLFDALDDARMEEAGRLIWESDARFVIGSSGVGFALAGHLRRPRPRYSSAGRVEQLIVMTGSCSAATLAQIEWAEANGFAGLRLDSSLLADETTAEAERARVRRAALELLSAGRSVVLYTARGPNDPAPRASLDLLRQRGFDEQTVRGRLGKQQGLLLRELLLESGLRRVCVAGGDTSSHAISRLGVYALELRTPLVPGQPLNRAYSDDAKLDGLEIALKGGQHGRADHFESIRRGSL